ncbi:uncharacterized protein KY384_000344 [Bacidia gigantensis]|uniref:uncharacterized protein n=1 Tax=Bacidia gigantensis TaxID=2732470 RepID=UPI001D055F01|nr:uncharacterized protein KY384_000344 [Bacidia gigantensis]KAG8526351.1 hypothetical protein KY384_000344 [Bacidia gigantensis]
MPPPFSEAFRAKIKRDLEEGKDDMAIRAAHNISARKIRAMRQLWNEKGEVWIHVRKEGSGRKPKIKDEHVEELKKLIAENPDVYVRDMTKFLQARCGLQVDETTVWRAVQKHNLAAQRRPRPKPRDAQGLWLPNADQDGDGDISLRYGTHEARDSQETTPATPNPPKTPTSTPRAKKPKPNAAEKLVERARDYAKRHMSSARFDGSHDWGHVERMTKMANHLLECEQAAHPNIIYDSLLLEVAALMHDIEDHKYTAPPPPPQPQQQNGYHPQPHAHPSVPPNPQTPQPPSYPWPSQMPPPTPSPPSPPQSTPHHHPGAPTRNIPPNNPILAAQQSALHAHLKAIRAPNHLIHVLTTLIPCISHSFSQSHPALAASTAVSHPELHILQDADRLDALGGVGIARAFMFAGARVRGPIPPPPSYTQQGMQTGIQHGGGGGSTQAWEKEQQKWLSTGGVMGETLRHFEEKIDRLEVLMWTPEAKRIARERTGRLEVFKGWLRGEMGTGDFGEVVGREERGGGNGGGVDSDEEMDVENMHEGYHAQHTEGARGEGQTATGGGAAEVARMHPQLRQEQDRRDRDIDPGLQLLVEMYGSR